MQLLKKPLNIFKKADSRIAPAINYNIASPAEKAEVLTKINWKFNELLRTNPENMSPDYLSQIELELLDVKNTESGLAKLEFKIRGLGRRKEWRDNSIANEVGDPERFAHTLYMLLRIACDSADADPLSEKPHICVLYKNQRASTETKIMPSWYAKPEKYKNKKEPSEKIFIGKNTFQLSIGNIDGKKVINFANNSKKFVEVIFTINGKEVKDGADLSFTIKGYAYPPKLEKPVKKMRDGKPLWFNPRGGEVVAYIFAGEGSYKDEDLDQPAFLRHKLVDKIKFKRSGSDPIKILKVKY